MKKMLKIIPSPRIVMLKHCVVVVNQGLYDLRWGRRVRAGTMPAYMATGFFTTHAEPRQGKDRRAQDQENCTLAHCPGVTIH